MLSIIRKELMVKHSRIARVILIVPLLLILLPNAAKAIAIVDLQVEGGGTAQVYELANGNLLGLWGFDARDASITTDIKITASADILGGFSNDSANMIVSFYNGANPVNTSRSEFDSLRYPFTIQAGDRLYNSLWIEWTGEGNLVYNFLGRTRTMGTTVTLTDDNSHISVPDASIMWLLGPALIFLGFSGRKKARV